MDSEYQLNLEYDDYLINKNRDIPVPKFVTTFEIKANELYKTDRCEFEKWDDWYWSLSQLSKDKWEWLRGQELFSVLFYPFCRQLDRVENLVKMMIGFFVLDDHADTEWGEIFHSKNNCDVIYGQFNRFLDRLVSGTHIDLSGFKPFNLAYYVVLDSISSTYNDIQKRRLIHCYKDYISGYQMESKLIRNETKPKCIEEQEYIRAKSIGALPCIQLIEYAENIFVSEQDWNEPNLQLLIKSVCLHIVYVNDLYSYEKELKQGKGSTTYMYNFVAFIKDRDSCSVTVAMNKVIDIIKQYELEIQRLIELITTDKDCSNEKSILAKRMIYVASGNYLATTKMNRYNNFSV